MNYSQEYIAQIVDAIIKLVMVVLPLLGLTISDDVKVQIPSIAAAIVLLVSFVISLFTAARIKESQALTVGGRYTAETPPQMKR